MVVDFCNFDEIVLKWFYTNIFYLCILIVLLCLKKTTLYILPKNMY